MTSLKIQLLFFIGALALCAFIPPTSHATILEELREMIRLHDNGSLSDITFSKHQVVGSKVIHVQGRKERRQARFAHWQVGLSGDQRRVFKDHGFPSYRHRESCMGLITEIWTYPDLHLTFVFQGDRLKRMSNY